MAVAAVFASHTPLKDQVSPGEGVARQVDACFAHCREWVREFRPDLVVAFGPDHFNGFFYGLMPSMCVGAAAESVGDWKTPTGALPVASEAAERLTEHAHAAGVDLAISYRMAVDHGFTQLLSLLFEWGSLPPILPVFINCAAPPLPPVARIVALGDAVGRFAASLDKNVLFLASGGLSHDPPMPSLATAPPEVRERIVAGGALSPQARAARETRVLEEGKKFVAGTSLRTVLNPTWDTAFLAMLRDADFDAVRRLADDDITRAAGCGGHEIRTWVAAAAAMNAVGPYKADVHFYRAIPEWIAGFGVMTATPS